MDKPHREIGERLRKWAKKEKYYSSMAEFARALGMNPTNLNSYLSGRFLPGNKLQNRLRDLGCDINWLMTGETEKEINQKFNRMIEEQKKNSLSDGEWEIVTAMRKLGIGNLMDFNIYFDYPKAIEDRTRLIKFKRVAEPRIKYQTNKSRREKK